MRKTTSFAKLAGLIAGGAMLMVGCAGQTSKMSDAEKAQQAVAKAESAVKKTRTRSDDWGLWKSTMGVLGNAKASLDQGDYQAAAAAANEARFQAERGLAQYREEKEEWRLAVKASTANGEFDEDAWIAGQD